MSASESKSTLSTHAHIQRNWITASSSLGEKQLDDEGGGVASVKGDDCITVVSYNILASIHIKPRGYPFCPTGSRETLERHPQLMEEICYHDNADIFCFQEVETMYYHETLLPEFRQKGFSGVFFQKALGIQEGVATFYRSSRLELQKQEGAHFKDLIVDALKKEQVDENVREAIQKRAEYETPMLLTMFQCRKTGRPLTIANVHLVWQTRIVPDLNTVQAAFAIRRLAEISEPGAACILCGDFNHQPSMPGYQLIRDGCLDDQSKQHLRDFPLQCEGVGTEQEMCLVDVLPHWFQHSFSSLRSSYSTIKGEEPPYTNYTDDYGRTWLEAYSSRNKLNGLLQEESSGSNATPRHFPAAVMDPALNASLPPPSGVRTLDYIWFSSGTLRCLGVEGIVDQSLITPFWACPNRTFPSDHLLMKAEFAFQS